jgi:hypothetical protein
VGGERAGADRDGARSGGALEGGRSVFNYGTGGHECLCIARALVWGTWRRRCLVSLVSLVSWYLTVWCLVSGVTSGARVAGERARISAAGGRLCLRGFPDQV